MLAALPFFFLVGVHTFNFIVFLLELGFQLSFSEVVRRWIYFTLARKQGNIYLTSEFY